MTGYQLEILSDPFDLQTRRAGFKCLYILQLFSFDTPDLDCAVRWHRCQLTRCAVELCIPNTFLMGSYCVDQYSLSNVNDKQLLLFGSCNHQSLIRRASNKIDVFRSHSYWLELSLFKVPNLDLASQVSRDKNLCCFSSHA